MHSALRNTSRSRSSSTDSSTLDTRSEEIFHMSQEDIQRPPSVPKLAPLSVRLEHFGIVSRQPLNRDGYEAAWRHVIDPRWHSWCRQTDMEWNLSHLGSATTAGPRGYSSAACKWISAVAKRTGLHILHAENGGRYSIPGTGWVVDGYCPATNTIYQYHDCALCGCARCYEPMGKDNTRDPGSLNLTRYNATVARDESLRQMGYGLVVKWGCS